MTTTFSLANPQKFQLVFPLLPEETGFTNQKTFSFNIIDGVMPSVSLDAQELPFRGGQSFIEIGGIEFGEWTTRFLIDKNYTSWLLLFNWMMSINDNKEIHGRTDQSYSCDAHLHLLDNFDTKVLDITFDNVWPKMLGEMQLSYQEDGSTELLCDVTFAYDRFYITRNEI